MNVRYLIIVIIIFGGFLTNAQTDFSALKQKFLDYRKADQQDSAFYIARKMNQLALKEQSDTSYWYALSMRYQGNPHDTWGNTDSTLFYWQKAVELFEKYHPESLDYTKSINRLVFLYYRLGDYKASEPIYKQAIEVQKKILGENNPDYALRLFMIGKLFYIVSDFQAAETTLKQSLEIRIRVLGEEHPDVGICLNSLGELYGTINNYRAAISTYEHYLEIKKKSVGEDHPDFAYVLDKLGNIYFEIGDYKVAETYYKQSLEIRKKVFGDDHGDIASALKCLGRLYSKMGDKKKAEQLYKQAVEIQKNFLGEKHSDFAQSLNDLGLFYYSIYDYKSAEPLFKEALEIFKKSQGYWGEDYAISLIHLGVLYNAMSDYYSAEQLYKQAMDIQKKFLGEEHFVISGTLDFLAQVYANKGDYEAAETYFKHSLEIRKKAFGDEHIDIARVLEGQGRLYSIMGDYKKAEQLYKQAIDIQKKVLGEEHPDYISNENSYAYLLTKTNREQEAYEILTKNFTIKSKQIANNFEWLSDNQKEAFWKQEAVFYDNLSWFASKVFNKVPEAVALNYNGALFSKSKLLEAKISKENYYNEVNEIREELAYRKRILNKLESDGSDKRDLMDKLRHEADSLDEQLELSWPAYAEQKRNLLITWDKVHQNLSTGEAAIEFVRFKDEEGSSFKYQALIIRKDLELPVLAPLCVEEALLDIEPKAGFSAYYPLVWEPMEAYLKDIHTIYYSPSGELYNVPFHAIYAPKENGDELIEAKTNKRGIVIEVEHAKTEENASFLMDRYTLHQLTSTRYLALGLKKKEKEKPETSIAIVGGVNYDYLPGDENTKSKKSEKSKKSNNRSSASASGKLAYLEGTKKETEAIHNNAETKSWETTYLEGNNAKEEKLTQFTDKEAKGILHIATHGYAFPEYSSLDTTIKENSLRYSYRFSQNPMVRSGLILAGGNWAWTGSDTLETLGAEENGILTALEVSGLNLRKTKLVVLSACETGLGKIEGSEGTFGLKRGFKLAGVEQMIVSLWSVPDKETMELMTLFYEDLTLSLNPVTSFEKAQKQMREAYPTRPDLWAGFVLVR